jgi:3-hydroxyisobutyrate dehydrogenase-like beta-hydroxyacid dehydrogenase
MDGGVEMRVGFVGVGNMGKYMAGNLIRRGHELVVCDRRPAVRHEQVLSGAHWAETPKDAAHAADVVITSLPGPTEVGEVVLGEDGIFEGIRDGACYVDMSTSTPASIRAIAEVARRRGAGVEVVDAPVAGGTRGARKGTLTIMAGGTETGIELCWPLLHDMGETVFHVGAVGAGHTAKLVNNMMTIVNGLVAMEAIVVGVKGGVDPMKLVEVAQAGTGGSYSLNVIPYVVLKGNFDPAKFALSLAAKDLRLAVEYASDLDVPVSVISHAAQVLAEAQEHGLGDLDWSSYITLIEQQANILVRS